MVTHDMRTAAPSRTVLPALTDFAAVGKVIAELDATSPVAGSVYIAEMNELHHVDPLELARFARLRAYLYGRGATLRLIASSEQHVALAEAGFMADCEAPEPAVPRERSVCR